jgi:hypothetical protein
MAPPLGIGIGLGLSFISPPSSGGGLDPDAAAFLAAASITDPTITSAIDSLVVDLKDYGIWNKMKAIYPFVGGTGTTHKFNLKDPQDLDTSYRLIFSGGITHSAFGAKGNGINGFANTWFNVGVELASGVGGLGFYSRTNIQGGREMGINVTNGSRSLIVIPRYIDNNFYANEGSASWITSANLDGRGFYTVTRTGLGASDGASYKNGVRVGTSSFPFLSFDSANAYIFVANGFSQFSAKECAFAYIENQGVTDADSLNLYNIVQAFQTTLGRQV